MPLPAQQVFSREFDADFFRLPEKVQHQIEAKIDEVGERLASFPHQRLQANPNFRLRAGTYRVIYSFDLPSNQLVLKLVGHRRDVYRWV